MKFVPLATLAAMLGAVSAPNAVEAPTPPENRPARTDAATPVFRSRHTLFIGAPCNRERARMAKPHNVAHWARIMARRAARVAS